MTTKFSIGEEVWVPAAFLTGNQPYSLIRRIVLGQNERSVIVDDRDGATCKVSSSRVHHQTLGFLLLRIGDLQTETTLLDPLAKSALQYLRLLVPDDVVYTLHARTTAEIRQYLAVQGASVSHLIIVGHGTSTSLKTIDGDLSGEDAGALLNGVGSPKTVISLACKTGQVGFAREVSRAVGCREFVAPFKDLHPAPASVFLQCLLHSHLVRAHGFATAVRAADTAADGTRFRHWRDGVQLAV